MEDPGEGIERLLFSLLLLVAIVTVWQKEKLNLPPPKKPMQQLSGSRLKRSIPLSLLSSFLLPSVGGVERN